MTADRDAFINALHSTVASSLHLTMMTSSPTRLWLLLLLVLLSASPTYASLSIVIAPKHEECVSVRSPSNAPSIIRGNFDCLDDELDPEDIRVMLTDSDSHALWKSERGESEDVFEVHVDGGRHYFCIENSDDENERTVGFALRISKPPRALNELEEGPDQERALDLVEWADELLDDWETLSDHYEYLKEREAIHRNLVERIFERVMRWTLLEAFTLVTIASCQVLYIRKFFETRRYL